MFRLNKNLIALGMGLKNVMNLKETRQGSAEKRCLFAIESFKLYFFSALVTAMVFRPSVRYNRAIKTLFNGCRISFISLLAVGFISCSLINKSHDPKQFTILGTADLQGLLDPYPMKLDINGDGIVEDHQIGGISRIAAIIKNIKSENKGGLAVISTGDDLMNRYFHIYKGEAIFSLLSSAGYEIYAFGNHEFDKGPAILASAIKTAKFKCICTDLITAKTSLEGACLPILIQNYQGIKVGFFSLMTEDFSYITNSKNVRLAGNNLSIAQKAVKQLKENGAVIIVAITHIGFDKDILLAKNVNDIDVIFGGHSHGYLGQFKVINDTIVVNGGEKGTHVVRLDLPLNTNGGIDLTDIRYQLIPVTENIAPDPMVEKALEEYRNALPEATILGHTEKKWDLTKKAVRQGESAVANLCNDLLKEKFKVDIVLNNAGAFRGKKIYYPGPITDVMLKEIDEFENYAYTLEIKGEYIMDILEHSAGNFGQGGLLHPSGLRYQINLARPAQKIIKKNDYWVIVDQGNRVSNIQVLNDMGSWVNLDPLQSYRVLSNGFLVNHDGDGYFWFKRYGKNLKNTYSTFYSILAEIVGQQGHLNPTNKDGRLKVIN